MSAKMNAQEFQTFYQEKFGLIYRYVYSKVGNREEAEDLTSEIFLKAVRSVDQQRSPQSRRNWLYRIASTTIADHWRTYYREPKASLDELLEAGWEGPAEDEPTAISNMEAHLIQSLLQTLPEHYREVLTCRFLLDLSIRATALRMGLSTENVRVLQFRALKRAANLGRVVEE